MTTKAEHGIMTSIHERSFAMNICTPESVGISSADVLKFYQRLDERCLSTHDVIIVRGDDVFTETYYAPFHKDFLHRMYSVSKLRPRFHI